MKITFFQNTSEYDGRRSNFLQIKTNGNLVAFNSDLARYAVDFDTVMFGEAEGKFYVKFTKDKVDENHFHLSKAAPNRLGFRSIVIGSKFFAMKLLKDNDIKTYYLLKPIKDDKHTFELERVTQTNRK